MHKILINMNTLKVVSYDTDIKPFQFAIEVFDLDTIKKVINQNNYIQKTNYLGEKLFSIIVDGNKIEATERDLDGKIGTPIYENNITQKTITFLNNPTVFTLDDILDNKITQLIKNYQYDNCTLFEINLQDNIELDYVSHKADTGFKLIRLHPNDGLVKFKTQNFSNGITKVLLNIESSANVVIKYSLDGEEYKNLDGFIIKSDKEFENLDVIIENPSGEAIDISALSLLF